MDQSHLGHFYVSDKGQWIHTILQQEHVQTQTLFDYDPILLTILLNPPEFIWHQKSTYFKANPNMLKREGTMTALQEVWTKHSPLFDDLTRVRLTRV